MNMKYIPVEEILFDQIQFNILNCTEVTGLCITCNQITYSQHFGLKHYYFE